MESKEAEGSVTKSPAKGSSSKQQLISGINVANGSEAAGNAEIHNAKIPSNVLSSTTNTTTKPIKRTSAEKTSATTTTTTLNNPEGKTITSTQKPLRQDEFEFAIHYLASFHKICVITALFPLMTLFTCFVSAYIFQYDDVHETHCRVYNIIPSISAITGVTPQTYFWRFSIALHVGPRIPIAFVYRNYYRSHLPHLRKYAPEKVPAAEFLIILVLVLNCLEIGALAGVTYISNRENYPVHEKIFITFMICSLVHMLATIQLNGLLFPNMCECSDDKKRSIKWKKILFSISILSTIGLLVFFAKHRFYCHELAFSWFAFFEYVIAVANMLFHFTIIWDFPSQYMLVVQGPRTKIEQVLKMPKKLE